MRAVHVANRVDLHPIGCWSVWHYAVFAPGGGGGGNQPNGCTDPHEAQRHNQHLYCLMAPGHIAHNSTAGSVCPPSFGVIDLMLDDALIINRPLIGNISHYDATMM